MKKTLILLSLVITCLLSCEKDQHNTNAEPTSDNRFPVTFSVSNFTQDNTPINQNSKIKTNDVAPAIPANILKVIYKVYDSNNILKKTIQIRKGAPGFPTIKDSLATGNYTGVFVGLVDTLHFNDLGDRFGYTANGTYDFDKGLFVETFYKKISFTVANNSLQQSVELTRLNSELQVILKDTVPANTGVLALAIVGTNLNYSYLNDQSVDIYNYNTLRLAFDPSRPTNFSLGPVSYIINTSSPIHIVITAYDKAGNISAQKTINNIMLKRNTRTIVTGYLFSNSSGPNNFNVTFNQNYNPNDINQGF